MRSSSLLAIFSIIVYFVTIPKCESYIYECAMCRGEDCNKEPEEECHFGEAQNHCRNRICKSGPNGPCGGPHNIAGVCGEGMMCLNYRCDGCYRAEVDDMDIATYRFRYCSDTHPKGFY